MRKKLTIVLFLTLVVSLCCLIITACAPEVTHNLTWEINPNVTVAVTGYNEPPKSVEPGTELTFTVTPKTGWAVTTVTPSNTVKKQPDGSYKFTVTKDLTIKVNAKEIVESLIVENTVAEYFAGEKVEAETLTVKAHYATGRDEIVSDYTVVYQGESGDAFVLGDTGYSVQFGGVEKVVEFEKAVVGKITVKLNGGSYVADNWNEFSSLFEDYNYDEEKGIVSWTFDKPFEADMQLPLLSLYDEEYDKVYTLKEYTGVKKNTIPKDNAVSLTLEAVYEGEFLKFNKLEFVLKEKAPYIIISGEWLTANKAQLVLTEGNEPKTELKGPEISRQDGVDTFVLEFDLREMVDWTNPDPSATKKTTLKGAWNDIRFFAKLASGSEATQEINLNDYPENFVDLGDELIAYGSRFSYKVHTPDGSSDRFLKLVYEDAPVWELSGVNLETKVVGEGENAKTIPALVFRGKVLDDRLTLDEAKAEVMAYINDISQLGGQWTAAPITKYCSVAEDFTFEFFIDLSQLPVGSYHFMHTNLKGDDGSLVNFSYDVKETVSVEVNDIIYRLESYAGDTETWAHGLPVVFAKPTKMATANPVTFEVDGDKVYFVVTGTYEGFTSAEDFKATIGQLDFENTDNGEDKTIIDKAKITVVFGENNTYTLKADITDLKAGQFWVHLTGVIPGNGDLGNDAGTEPVECGNKTYAYANKVFSWGNKMVCTVIDNSTFIRVSGVELKVEGEGAESKLYYEINYVYDGHTKEEIEALTLFFALDGNPKMANGTYEGDWEARKPVSSVIVLDEANKTFKLRFDISNMANENPYCFTTKFGFEEKSGGGAPDFKPDIDSFTGTEVQFGGKVFQLSYVKGGTDEQYFGCVGLKITAAQN